ncbi:MAG: putative Ig domain-containing protein [Proteobacteria bacterium]|nr:putative Ig domain-containing protein [Pseudomonadota bacterium]
MSTPNTAVRPLSTYAYDAEANRSDPLTWSLIEGPSGMTVDTATGLVSWTPSPAQRGTHPVRLSVTDGRESTEQSYLLLVSAGAVLPNGLHPAALAALVHAARGGRNWLGELATRPLSVGRATGRLAPRPTSNALSRELLRYVIGCALPLGTALRIDAGAGSEAFQGQLGLAPRWQTRSCDGACRALVSACVLARTNALGLAVPIAWAATAPGRLPAAQLSAEGLRLEGAFYGDLFAPRPMLLACAGAAAVGPAADGRSCTTSPAACGFTIAGPCAELCEPWLGQALVACRAGRGLRRYRALVVLAPRGERGP